MRIERRFCHGKCPLSIEIPLKTFDAAGRLQIASIVRGIGRCKSLDSGGVARLHYFGVTSSRKVSFIGNIA
jgi:hypothetical protein